MHSYVYDTVANESHLATHTHLLLVTLPCCASLPLATAALASPVDVEPAPSARPLLNQAAIPALQAHPEIHPETAQTRLPGPCATATCAHARYSGNLALTLTLASSPPSPRPAGPASAAPKSDVDR